MIFCLFHSHTLKRGWSKQGREVHSNWRFGLFCAKREMGAPLLRRAVRGGFLGFEGRTCARERWGGTHLRLTVGPPAPVPRTGTPINGHVGAHGLCVGQHRDSAEQKVGSIADIVVGPTSSPVQRNIVITVLFRKFLPKPWVIAMT